MEAATPDMTAFFSSLREGMAQNAHVRTIYGEPVVSGDKTVIPVARIAWGFGGGMGQNAKHGQAEGGGGGGGMTAIPVGVVEVTPQGTRFIRFGGTRSIAGAIMLGILLGMCIGRKRRRERERARIGCRN